MRMRGIIHHEPGRKGAHYPQMPRNPPICEKTVLMKPGIMVLLTAAGILPAADRVSFSETIAPILYNNCVTCHRPGEAAPFSLISYEDAKKRGSLIAAVTKSRYMPPWHAAHGYGEFAGERRLTDEQIAVIAEWVKQGMPEGDRSKMPKVPQFTEGWQLGKPDLVLEMPAAFEVPAGGPDIYRNFAIPTRLAEDKWVRAIELRPSARKAVHHVLYAYDGSGATAKLDGADGKPGFSGMSAIGVSGAGAGNSGSLGGWAVGATPQFLPENLAFPLPKGSHIVLQMHFHPTGKAESEKSTVGIYFAPQPPERRIMGVQGPALFGFGAGIDIPAGDKQYVIEDSITLPVDVRAVAAGAHAHYIAKEMKATATLPDGSTRPLLWIQDWDFNWQDRYNYKDPVALPKGTRIDIRITYDNSADNPRNPSQPPKPVKWGEQSFDEMGSVTLISVAQRKEDEPALQQFLAGRTREAIARGVVNGAARRYQQQQQRSPAR
jgi:mono/diheme cytochrome c family protein